MKEDSQVVTVLQYPDLVVNRHSSIMELTFLSQFSHVQSNKDHIFSATKNPAYTPTHACIQFSVPRAIQRLKKENSERFLSFNIYSTLNNCVTSFDRVVAT